MISAKAASKQGNNDVALDKRTHIILWSSVAAATAGIAVVAAVVRFRQHRADEAGLNTHLRDVQEVLADCYTKIQEIEARLPDLSAGPLIPDPDYRFSRDLPRESNSHSHTEN